MNANTGHIINVDKSDDVIRNDAGVQQTLPRDSLAVKGMQLAYSATAHDYQGSTVDRVLMAMESKEQLATQKSFYVGLSRMRDNTELVTDDVGKLIDTIQKHSGERVLALEAIAEQTASQATQTLAVRTASEVANSPAQAALDKRPSGTPDTLLEAPEKARAAPASDNQNDPEKRSAEQDKNAHKNDPENQPRKDADEERHITAPRTAEERAKDMEDLKQATLEHARESEALRDQLQQMQRGQRTR